MSEERKNRLRELREEVLESLFRLVQSSESIPHLDRAAVLRSAAESVALLENSLTSRLVATQARRDD